MPEAAQFPADDDQFEEYRIAKVERDGRSFAITSEEGWSLWCGEDCPITPEPGQTARQYGKGIGYPVRGLFIDGIKLWYRTAAEDAEKREIDLYGADAAGWLARWDAGKTVWSISMGGLGPGYEQCIHITTAEILRWFLHQKVDASRWDDPEFWQPLRDRMEKAVHDVPAVKALGLSGAQFGAAINLASQFYQNGPRKVMGDPRVKERHIQVSRRFPGSD